MAGGLRIYRCAFLKHSTVSLPSGGKDREWVQKFAQRGEVIYLAQQRDAIEAGGETGNASVKLLLLNSGQLRRVDHSWRVELSDRSGVRTLWVLRSDPRPARRPGYLEIMIDRFDGSADRP